MSWMHRLEELIQQKHLLSHPFYQAWSRGALTKTALRQYAQEYYHHVKAFPTYLSALHSRSEDPLVRRALLDNLIDEEAGHPNHPDLWRSFALALGCPSLEAAPHPGTQTLVDTFHDLCRNCSLGTGIAALYSYESQIPALCQTKIDGLRKWYGMTDPADYRYFSVHETADVEHARAEQALLAKIVRPEEEEPLLKGAERALNALWDFLSSFEIRCRSPA